MPPAGSRLTVASSLIWLGHALLFERCNVDVCPNVLPWQRRRERNVKLESLKPLTIAEAQERVYDYIIVGGGGGGCPLARTLADGGKRVLLVERGGLRKDHILTQDIYGSGMVIADEEVSQVVITPSGVRTHMASVLGGGTATGMAIAIEENAEYWDVMEGLSHTSVNRTMLQDSFDWLRSRTSEPMSEAQPYSDALKQGLLEQGFRIDHGSSARIQNDGVWNAHSLFNKSDGYFRNSADVLLSSPLEPQPSTLDVVVNTTATKILFDELKSEAPRARCVALRPTRPSDTATIDSRAARAQSIWWNEAGRDRPLLKHLTTQIRLQNSWRSFVQDSNTTIICARTEIILSAGTVNTVTLLARSGVGNPGQMEELGFKDPVKSIPKLGKNLVDRGLIPVAYFRKGRAPPGKEMEPQVCGVTGMAPVGEDCSSFRMAKRTETCSMTGAEEITGGRILEGFVYATRLLFPPQLRSSLLLDEIIMTLASCSDSRKPSALCSFLSQGVECMRKLSATWYFVNEPKSRGFVKLLRDGNIIVDPRYYSHPQDVADGIRGIGNLIKVAESKALVGVMEGPSELSCPWLISNLLTTITSALSSWSRRVITDEDARVLTKSLNDPRGAAATIEMLAKTQTIENESHFSLLAARRQRMEEQKELERLQWALDHPDSDEMRNLWPVGGFGGTGGVTGMASGRQPFVARIPPPAFVVGKNPVATFPPLLPETGNNEDVKDYINAMMQSMWHLAGTAALGDVVDSQFRIKGLRNISIVDASVLTQVTRMNPTQTIMAISRYAGLLKLRGMSP